MRWRAGRDCEEIGVLAPVGTSKLPANCTLAPAKEDPGAGMPMLHCLASGAT